MSTSAFVVAVLLVITGIVQSFDKSNAGLAIAGAILLAGAWIADAIRQAARRTQSEARSNT
jgi:hypothetical protein